MTVGDCQGSECTVKISVRLSSLILDPIVKLQDKQLLGMKGLLGTQPVISVKEIRWMYCMVNDLGVRR